MSAAGEFNKYAGAVLGALTLTMGLSLFSGVLVSPSKPEKPGYDLPEGGAAPQAAAGAAAVVLVLVAILADETTREFLMNRAKLVQDYDGARLGRLARHLIGFLWVTELPLGLGPLDFGYYYGEDPHNVYLKGFLAYGWLGGLSYLVLVFWTIGALFPLMFKPRPWQPYAQVVWVCLIGHLIVGWIIDSDHWRHFFMLWGLAWGMVALEAAHRRRMARTLPARPAIGAFEAART